MHTYHMSLDDCLNLTLIQYAGLLNRIKDVTGKLTDEMWMRLKSDRMKNNTW